MSERNPDVTKVGELTASPNQSLVSAGCLVSESQQIIIENSGKSSSSTVVNNGGEKDHIQWNISPENLEDKNPFSGFSEEHLSKLDEFLSSEEAKKILQQTTEGDFTNTMSELASSGQGMQGEDVLKLDLMEGMNSHPANLDHAYCIRTPKQSLTQNITATSKVVVVTVPTVINYSPVLPPPTAVSAETTNSMDNSSPRMSATIQLKQSEEEKTDDSKEQLHPGFVGAVHPGIVQPQHAGMPTIELGRGRGRGRRSLLPEDRLDIRRSSRISDQEQRDLAEKIRQENLQREKEAMEELKKKEEKGDTCKKTTGRRGRPPKVVNEDTAASTPRGIKSSHIRKEEEDESEEDVSETEDSSPSKAKSSPRISARATKGKKAKRFLEESEKSSVSPKKGMKTSMTDSEDSPMKGKKKGKKLEESSSDSESEEDETVKEKKGKGRKKSKNMSDSDEEDSKLKGKKKNKGKNVEKVSDSDSEVDEEAEESTKKGKKKVKLKKASGVDDKSKLGKQKGKKGKKGKALDSDSAVDTSKKGKKALKEKKKAETESDSDDSDNECLALKAKRQETDSEEMKTPEKDKAKSNKSDEVSRSPRSIFKVIGSIEQSEDSAAVEEVQENSVTYEAEVTQISKPANEAKTSEQEITIEFVSKVEEMSYEQFLSSVGGAKEEENDEIKAGPSGEGNKSVDSKQSDEASKLHFSKTKRDSSDSVSKSGKNKEEPTQHEQKLKKLAKKKVRKSEDIVVDPSMMDLFKPDLDTPKHAKKEPSESGSAGKEEGHTCTRKISTESQSSDKSKSKDHHRDKRSRSSSDHKRDSSDRKGEKHRSHHSHHHKSSSRKLSLDSDKSEKKTSDSKSNDSHASKSSDTDSLVIQVKEDKNDEIGKGSSSSPDIENRNDLSQSKKEPHVQKNEEESKADIEQDQIAVPMETSIEDQKPEKDVKSDTKQEKVVRFEKDVKPIKTENKKQHKETLSVEKGDSDDSRRFRREKSREQQKKVLDAVMKNEASEEEQEEEDSDDVDEEDSDYEAPDEKYCICQQPYGKRFMICCDKCEQWFHGSCVGVSRSRGKEMEKNNEEYICPVCLGTEKMPGDKNSEADMKQTDQGSADKLIQKREDTAKKKERPSSGEVKFTKLQEEKRESHKHVQGSKHREDGPHPKKHVTGSSKVPDKLHSSHKHKDVKKEEQHKSMKKPSNEPDKHKVKDMAAQRCVVPGCNKFAKRESVYCSTDHIHKHAKDSLKFIHKQELELGRKSVDVRRVTVIEKKSGKILSGPNAPLETILKTWLEHHPTFEVVKPRPRNTSTSKNKDKDVEQRSPREKTTTVSTILVKKEDIKEKREPVVTEKKEEKKEEKKDGPDIVRLNVRKSLRDALINRAESANDVMVSDNEIRTIALHIEEELFTLFTEISHKYKSKYRSLIFNIKDSRNQGLFRKVLNGQIKPYSLVRMSAEELASKELAKWREHEAKHQLEMIVEVEKEHMKEREHIVKKTHKGEIDLDEDMSTLKDKGVEKPKEKKSEEVDSQSDLISSEPTKALVFDTTNQHKMHLFDLNCKICTGKMAPPAEESTPTKKIKVATNTEDKEKKTTEKSEAKKTVEEQTKAEEVVKEVLKAIKKAKAEAPKADSTVTVRSPDSALQSGLEKPKFTPSSPMLWKGFIQMQDVAKFVTTAYRVSGPADKADLPDTIHVCGRIAPEQIWDYLAKMKMVATKDIVILRFLPCGDEEKTSYINLYSYLNSRARCGVVGNKGKHIKDFYILPLASHSKIPSVLEPFDGPGLEKNRPHMLLAIIVKQKHKRSSDSDRHDSKKSKVEFVKSKTSHKDGSSYTPPSSSKGKTKSAPKLKSILKKESPRSGKPSSSTSTPSSSSTLSTPGEVTPGVQPPSQGSKDPIVQVYGEGGTLSEDSMDVPATSTSAEDIPYDPEDDSQLPYKQARPADVTKTAPTQNKVPQMVPPPDPLPTTSGVKVPQMVSPPATNIPQMVPPPAPLVTMSKTIESPTVTTKTAEVIPVDELIGKIAKSANPADATAITVAAITELKTVQEKRKFLLDLTSCVEQQKKLLEEKKSAMLTARTLVSAIYAISAASKALIPLAKAAKVETKTTHSPDVSSSNVTTTSAPAISNPEISVSMVTSSVTSVTQSVTTSTSMSKVMVTDSVTSHMSPQKSQSDGSIKPALSNSFSGVKEVKVTKSVSFANEVITNTVSGDTKSKPGGGECFEDPCDVDLRPKYVEPMVMNVTSKIQDSVYSQEYPSENKNVPASVPVSESTSSISPVPATSAATPQQSMDPGKMPEALKSLFSVIPGSNYSHLSNIKDSKSEEKVEVESYKLANSGQSSDGVSSKPAQSSQFNVKLLDFDYGDSDSDEEIAKQSSKKEEEEEITVLPYETELKKFEEEQNQLEKEMGTSDDKDSEHMPSPPPLPQDELPPLPAEPPPPLPEHDPEEEEDEAQKKKKKKKPPPEIVLQPKDPVGKAILEATFMKITAQNLPLPPPPLPPMPLTQGTLPPTSMPTTIMPPSAMPNVPPVMGGAPPVPSSGVAPPLSVGAPPIVPPGPVPMSATPGMPPMPMPGAPMVGDMMAQTPSGMPIVNAVPGVQGPVNTPKILIDSLPPVQEYVNPFRKRKRPKVQNEQGNIPSLFEIEVAPTKPLNEDAMNEVDTADSTTGWVEDEALTLPLEDQDFRRDQDFRNEDVDERKWRRQKFPPPWAQDVDHRVGSSESNSTLNVSSKGNQLSDNQFYGDEQGDVDYRGTHYSQPRHHETKFEYAEDQDYRSPHHYRSSHRKRRKFHSREGRKKSRWENNEDTDQRSKDKSKRDRIETNEKTDEKKESSAQEVLGESSTPVPPRPHRIAEELPLPKPPPGVVSSASNSSTNSPVSSLNSSTLPPGVDPPMGRPPGPHPSRPPLPRSQPAPPGVDDWS